MKNKSTLATWLFRPFTFIAGSKALAFGVIVLSVISVVGYLSNTHFDGILDIHYGSIHASTPYMIHAFYQLSTWLILTIVFYVTAHITSKSKTRLIDIAGTMALSQAPLLFAALSGFMPFLRFSMEEINTMAITAIMETIKENIIPIIVAAIICMAFAIWSVILRYNAYSVSANLKGAVAWISFGLALLVSEIISIIAIYLIIPLIK